MVQKSVLLTMYLCVPRLVQNSSLHEGTKVTSQVQWVISRLIPHIYLLSQVPSSPDKPDHLPSRPQVSHFSVLLPISLSLRLALGLQDQHSTLVTGVVFIPASQPSLGSGSHCPMNCLSSLPLLPQPSQHWTLQGLGWEVYSSENSIGSSSESSIGSSSVPGSQGRWVHLGKLFII